MNKLNFSATIVLLAFMFVGCQLTGPTPNFTKTPVNPEAQAPHVRGQIISIYQSDGKVTGFLVEGVIESDTVYAKAIVGVNGETQIYIKTGNSFTPTDVSYLEEGQTVEVLFAGPIQTSDPVQAEAIQIIIIR